MQQTATAPAQQCCFVQKCRFSISTSFKGHSPCGGCRWCPQPASQPSAAAAQAALWPHSNLHRPPSPPPTPAPHVSTSMLLHVTDHKGIVRYEHIRDYIGPDKKPLRYTRSSKWMVLPLPVHSLCQAFVCTCCTAHLGAAIYVCLHCSR